MRGYPVSRDNIRMSRVIRQQQAEIRKQINKDLREKDRAKLRTLRMQIHQAKLRLAEARREARHFCARERVKAQSRCAARQEESVAPARLDVRNMTTGYVDERNYQRSLRRIEQGNRLRERETRQRAPGITRATRRAESDDEVRQNIPPELVQLFNKVRRHIHGSLRMSRTEEFLKYAEEHPNEVLEAYGDQTEKMIAEMEQRERQEAEEYERRYAVPF